MQIPRPRQPATRLTSSCCDDIHPVHSGLVRLRSDTDHLPRLGEPARMADGRHAHLRRHRLRRLRLQRQGHLKMDNFMHKSELPAASAYSDPFILRGVSFGVRCRGVCDVLSDGPNRGARVTYSVGQGKCRDGCIPKIYETYLYTRRTM